MAQIQEYTPEVASPEPVGGVSPNIELAGAVGKSIENIGGQLGQMGDLIHRRNAQQDTANVYSDFADARADFNNQIAQKTQDGSLDPDQLMQDFDNQTTDLGSNISTPEGRNYFERQQSRLRAQLQHSANTGMSQIAQRQAQGKFTNYLDKTSSTVMQNPDLFDDTSKELVDTVDQMIATGGLPEKSRDMALQKGGAQLAKGAIYGMAMNNPAAAKEALDSGKFNDFFDADDMKKMYGDIQQQSTAQRVQRSLNDTMVEKAKEAHENGLIDAHYGDIRSGKMGPQDITKLVQSGQMRWQTADRLISIQNEVAKQGSKSNPATIMDLQRRIYDFNAPDALKNSDPILQAGATGQANPDEVGKLLKAYGETDSGKRQSVGEKGIFNISKEIAAKDPMTGIKAPDADTKSAKFLYDFYDYKQKLRGQGKDPDSASDPRSPDYFANPETMKMYQTTWQQQMQNFKDDRQKKALGTDDPTKAPNPDAIKPGEDLDDWLNWKNHGAKRKVPGANAAPEPPNGSGSVSTAPVTPAEQVAQKASSSDDLGYLGEMLGFSGPAADARRKKQTADYKKRSDDMRKQTL